MVKVPKCKICETQKPEEFVQGRKNICKKCINDKQQKLRKEQQELLNKLKSEESKPRSPTPSRESYETFRQAIVELNSILENQREVFEKQTQEFQIFKSLSDTKFQYLETQILTLQQENQELKTKLEEVEESEISSESSRTSSRRSVTPESSIPSPVPSPIPSPIRSRSPVPSPVRINPEKKKILEIIDKLKETLEYPAAHTKGFKREKLIDLCAKFKLNRQGKREKPFLAKLLLEELEARLAVC
jgi:hypothetical protein